MKRLPLGRRCLLLPALCLAWLPSHAQAPDAAPEPDTETTLSGSDRSEHDPEHQHHFLGEWGGKRPELLRRGVSLDLQYESDTLWNARSPRKTRSAVFARARGTVDVDFARLTETRGLKLHVTAVWQGGGSLGAYLGQFAGPSGLDSANSFRLDSWWLDKAFRDGRVAFRIGQFAAGDFYGSQVFGPSFIFEPLQYALDNLTVTYETFDPPSTSAAELRVAPTEHTYIRSMVYAADRLPFAHNRTGLVPDFRGAVSSASEIGWSPGKHARSLLPQDTVESRRGFAGLYKFGAVWNPGRFQTTQTSGRVGGDYLIYGMLNQAVFRTDPKGSRGLDVTAGADWSPSDRNRTNQVVDFGLRLNEPLPIRLHNTVGIAWVRTGIGDAITLTEKTRPPNTAEQGIELNLLLDIPRGILVQPVAQYYLHSGGGLSNAAVFGLHTKVDF